MKIIKGKTYQCPYCNYHSNSISAKDDNGLWDHLTYYHFMTVNAAEKIILEKKKER